MSLHGLGENVVVKESRRFAPRYNRSVHCYRHAASVRDLRRFADNAVWVAAAHPGDMVPRGQPLLVWTCGHCVGTQTSCRYFARLCTAQFTISAFGSVSIFPFMIYLLMRFRDPFFNLPNPSGRTRPWGLLSL
jgi:hypothetical protein